MTNDGALSQDEIEALLQGADEAFGSSNGNPVTGGSDIDKALMDEAVKIILDNQAFSLSSIITKNVTMSNVSVVTSTVQGLQKILSGKLLEVKVTYDVGNIYFYVRESEATIISTLLMGQQETELTETTSQALKEVFSQTVNASDNALVSRFGGVFENTGIEVSILENSSSISIDKPIAIASNTLSLEGEIENAPYILAIDMPLLQSLISKNKSDASMIPNNSNNQNNLYSNNKEGSLGIKHADFNNLMPSTDVNEESNIGLLMDVTMNMTVELGRATMTIRDILSLGEGSIIELQKLAGEPVDLLVNGKLIARGEVVVIDENFGVRVTDIISQIDRVVSKTR